MRDETRNWISKGDKDLGTAGFALNSIDGPLPVTTSLHCQKAVENYLRAYLQENDISFSSQHNLNTLFESCCLFDNSFKALHMDIDQIEGYSIASRYPKAEDSLEFRKEAVSTTKRLKEFVLGKLA